MCNIHMTQQSIHVFYSITLVYFGILPILLFLQNMRSFSFHCLKVNSVHFNFSEWNGQTFIASLRMWDVDDSGSINVTEMTNIIATMDDVEGEEQDPKVKLQMFFFYKPYESFFFSQGNFSQDLVQGWEPRRYLTNLMLMVMVRSPKLSLLKGI